MNKVKSRNIWAIAIAVALIVALIAPTIALASSYDSPLSFSISRVGEWRAYDGKNITISLTASESLYLPQNRYFTVTLQRQIWWWPYWSDVGTVKFNRKGYTSKTWTNVGAGTYRFYFEKANDSVTIKSDHVKMEN